MLYLFFQTWAWIVSAFVIGIFVGWWLCGRCNCVGNKQKQSNKADSKVAKSVVEAKSTDSKVVTKQLRSVKKNELKEVNKLWQPAGLKSKPKGADDLKRISGVGPVIEKKLHKLGIYQFQQIADFSAENITWVDKHMSFRGRIKREKWVSQAKQLLTQKTHQQEN